MMAMPFVRFAGKRVVVTGGANGIGLATVHRFLSESAKVFVLDSNPAGLDTLIATTGDVVGLVTDVSDPTAVEDAFRRIDQWGPIDVLVNNAGISSRRCALEMTAAEWRLIIDTNLSGAFWVAKEAAKRMLDQGAGIILNMASVSGLVGMPLYAHYNAAKAGVIEFTRTLALELAPSVRVNAVCPGYILTPMQRFEYSAEMLRECEMKLPLKRLGTAEEIAALIAFLSSEEASFITGQAIVADGGETAGGLASR